MGIPASPLQLVDTHAHVISGDVDRYPILESARASAAARLADPFCVERLLAEMEANSVTAALLVQRGQFYGDDNSYVCAAAARAPQRLRPVCAIDARQPDCGRVARSWLARGAAGFRLMQSQPNPDVGWLGGENAAAVWRLSSEHALPLGVHFWPANRERGLAMLHSMMEQFPATVVVIDHLSNGPIDAAGQLLVDDALRRLAETPNVIMKVTTIPLGRLVGPGLSPKPLMRAARGLFGAERLIWGSDIGQSPGTYSQMSSFGLEAVVGWPPAQRQAILAGNARRIYRLNPDVQPVS